MAKLMARATKSKAGMQLFPAKAGETKALSLYTANGHRWATIFFDDDDEVRKLLKDLVEVFGKGYLPFKSGDETQGS